MMRLALLFVAACSVRPAKQLSDAACSHSDAGTPYTPGTVACGGAGTCAAGNCYGCVGSVQFDYSCGMPPDAQCNFVADCDGPEDCPSGMRCYAFESAICASTPPAGGFYVVCHTDADCDCGDHCDNGICRA